MFCCHAAGLVIEVDGQHHQEREESDAERSRYFAARGLAVLRFSNNRIATDVAGVLGEILQFARRRTVSYPPPHLRCGPLP